MATKIIYSDSGEAWKKYRDWISQLAGRDLRLCEIGGGANPLLGLEEMREKGLQYNLLDISEEELQKAPEGYRKIVMDASSPDFSVGEKFDLVFSKMLLEHIRDAKQFHQNVLKILADGGLAVHFFPTLYSLPFVANLLLPETLALLFYNFFGRRDSYQHAKFPAYYRWCRGPLTAQIEKFQNLGYEVVEYRGFFGHFYFDRVQLLKKLERKAASYLLKHPSPLLTSYAFVVLRKPSRQ
jgi:SAM-dependent methyltransferase